MLTTLDHILDGLTRLNPTSRDEMVTELTRVLGDSLIKTIDTHNTKSIIFILACDLKEYVLKAEFGKNTATTQEIYWYKQLPVGNLIAPALYRAVENNVFSFLVLSYLSNAQTLDEMCLDTNIASREINAIMHDALRKDQMLYNANERVPLKNDVDSYYGLKYRQRREEAKNYPFLASLFNANTFTINGKQSRSIDYYIERIQKEAKLYNYLTPEEGGTIHGDLHFGNILCVGNDSFLIDPNGRRSLPFEYDLGKLLHSVHGNFGSIMRGRYSMSHSDNEYILDVDQPVHFGDCFSSLKESFDTQTFLRGLYSEAMHFATMLPHHAAEKNETTALFLTCVRLFSELFEYLGIPTPISTQRSQHV